MYVLLLVNFAKAQNWGGGIDDERFNWGFSFQYISSEYKLIKKSNWRDPFFDAGLNKYVTDSLSAIYSPNTPGFGIGFVVNSNITSNFDVRFTPTLVFSDRMINYNYGITGATAVVQKKYQSTAVDFPFSLKLKSDRIMNFRAYMLSGLKYTISLTSSKKNDDAAAAPIDKLLKNKQSFLSYEAGLGFDIYFEYFKMSPEIKLSYSFKDVLNHDPSPYSNPIDKAKLRHFTFSLFFE